MSFHTITPEKRYRMSLLLDRYGLLLTDRQRDLMHRYYEEDLSLGEVAAQVGVSRQAVFDAVKHGEASLDKYENALGLVEGAGIDPKTASRAARRLRDLAEGLGASPSASDLDSASLIEDLEAIAEDLESAGSAPAPAPSSAPLSISSPRPAAASASASASASRAAAVARSKPSPSPRPSFLRGDGPEVD